MTHTFVQGMTIENHIVSFLQYCASITRESAISITKFALDDCSMRTVETLSARARDLRTADRQLPPGSHTRDIITDLVDILPNICVSTWLSVTENCRAALDAFEFARHTSIISSFFEGLLEIDDEVSISSPQLYPLLTANHRTPHRCFFLAAALRRLRTLDVLVEHLWLIWMAS